jgi:hypothetical protein
MVARGRAGSWLATGAAVAAVVLAADPARAESRDFITAPGAAVEAVGKIIAESARTPRLLRIEIRPNRVDLVAQASDKSWHLEEWSFEHANYWLFTRERVSGPRPVEASGPFDDVESGLFDLAEIDLRAADRLAEAAIARAALEDAAAVTAMTIERRIAILPRPRYGEIRWTVEVASPHEAATVYANPRGEIVALDLSRTRRAKLLDLLADDWPAEEAQRQLEAVLGPHAIVHSVRLYSNHISVEGESASDPQQAVSYAWDLSGVRRGLALPDMPNLRHLIGDRAAFAFAELDLTVLAGLREEAKRRLDMPDGAVTAMDAAKSTMGIGAPAVEWRVRVTDRDGAKGEVVADAKGNILAVIFPEGRRAVLDRLAPEGVRASLDRLAQAFGADTRFLEISLDDARAHIVAEDPREAGAAAQFHDDGGQITRFGRPLLAPYVTNEQAFTLEETATIEAPQIRSMIDESRRRLALADGRVFRITFSRGNVFVASSRGLITVEVRVQSADGGRDGRVTFEADGTVIDVVLP